jgi:hypothetical protein
MGPRAISALVASFLAGVPVALAAPESFESTLQKLFAICAAHPGFRASSIDFYRPRTSALWERTFYEAAATMHSHTNEAVGFLLDKRKTSNDDQKRCIDSILNTWPG